MSSIQLRHGRSPSRSARLMGGAALAALTCLAVGVNAAAAQARAASAPAEVEEVVVTGTNIRGAAPVGQNIVQIDRKMIESTAAVSVQQLLSTAAPQLNGFGASGQSAGSFEPRLRSLGGSSSASTLVLVDGHRITPGAGIANTADPNIVPAGAVERVEILPDGASALYGSDAVAGVINIITRKNYRGFEVSGQGGFGKDYRTQTASVVYGTAWDSGSLMATYGYSHASNLFAGDRAFVSGNQSSTGPGATGAGGANFNSFACYPASVIPSAGQAGAGQVFSSPYTGAGIANSPTTTGLCSTVRNADLLPDNTSNRIFVSLRQQVTDRIKVSASLLYSTQKSITRNSRGTITNVNVFGPGSTPTAGVGQINPFFAAPAGVNRAAVSVSFDDLLGPGARTIVRQETMVATFTADFDLGREWQGSLLYTAGLPTSGTVASGAICQVCAYIGLNGTAVASGVPTTNLQGNGLGTVTTVTRLPLTTANALDVWNPATSNRTSAAVLAQLTDSDTFSNNKRPITDVVAKFDGPLFKLPGGRVMAAVGGELYLIANQTTATTASVAGGSSTAAAASSTRSDRRVISGFAEIVVPVVGEEMGVPLMQKLDLDISGRIDKYNDLTKDNRVTKNPKIGVSWTVVDSLLLRANYGTSFTAPTVGATALFTNGSTIRDYFGVGSAAFVLPQGYPNSAFLGCPATGTCTISSASGKNGIITFGGNPDLAPQRGKSWSAGFDFRPRGGVLDGFHANVTYWNAVYRGIITNLTNVSQSASTPGLEGLLIINPTADQLAKATFGRIQTTPISTPITFINVTTQTNMFNVEGNGLDVDIGYQINTDGLGTFAIGGSGEYKFKWKKQTGNGAWLRATNIGNTANTFSPLRFAGRGSLSWRKDAWRADLFANYVDDYYLTDATIPFANAPCPANVTTTGLGCQHVGSFTTFDTHISYDFQNDGLLRGLQLFGDVRNLADKRSPFINSTDTISANGSLNTYGNPIGRVVSVGFRKKW